MYRVIMKLIIQLALICASVAAYPKYFHDINGFIVGGHDANIEDFPYILSLRVYDQHVCGASVIAARWALTAAHCVEVFEVNFLGFRGGSPYHMSGVSFKADEINIHPNYNVPTRSNNDVAVVRVTSSFIVSGIVPVALATNGGDMFEGRPAHIMGWGATSYEGPSSYRLKLAEIMIVSRSDCAYAYNRIVDITDSMLCAAYPGRDACQGDSGGPLVNLADVQHGIVSFGYECANPLYPGVYTRVGAPNIRNWINLITGI